MPTNQLNLFDDAGNIDLSSIPAPKKPVTTLSWRVVDHACRFCLGRVLQRVVKGVTEVRCAQCGNHAVGGPVNLCCCGADCGEVGVALECYKNQNVTNEVPHEIMVRERLVDVEEQARPAAKPVRINKF